MPSSCYHMRSVRAVLQFSKAITSERGRASGRARCDVCAVRVLNVDATITQRLHHWSGQAIDLDARR